MTDGANSVTDRMKIRKARWTDARRAVPLVRGLAGEASEKAAMRRFRRLVLRPSYFMAVAELDDRLIGLLLARSAHFLGADAPYIEGLGVIIDPEYRGTGASLMLMSGLAEMGVSHGACQVTLTTQHEGLHKYYEAFGFEATGTRFVMHMGGQDIGLRQKIMRRLGI